MEVSRGRIWLSRQPDSQAFALLTADSSTLSTQGRLSLPGPFLQIFQSSLLGPGRWAFQSPLKLPRVHVKEVIMVPGERIYASSNLAGSPIKTCCLCGREKILMMNQSGLNIPTIPYLQPACFPKALLKHKYLIHIVNVIIAHYHISPN